MILGQPGAGKSTLARRLGAATGLPVHHVDRIHWMPGWTERPHAEKVPMARAIEASERWIFEGGLSATWPERAARADLILWLDVALPLRLWRVWRRRWEWGGRTRPDLPEDCPEQITWEFTWFILRTARRSRARMAALAAEWPGKSRRIASRREADALVAEARGWS